MEEKNLSIELENIEDNEDISMEDFDIRKQRELWLNLKKKVSNLVVILVVLLIFLYFVYSVDFYYKSFFYWKIPQEWISRYSYNLWKLIKDNVIDKFLNKGNENININLEKISSKASKKAIERQIDSFINSNISYLEKRQILSEQVKYLISQIKSAKRKIDELTHDISRYAFLPKQIDELIKGGDISNILFAVDWLKIVSIMQLYKYLPSYMKEFIESDTFLREDNLVCKQLELARWVSYYTSRWEKDIKNFLKMCYLNPYELDRQTCNVGEFDYYYNNVLKIWNIFNPWFFKELVSFIINKSKDNKYSNIQIIFNTLDPKNRQIGFSTLIRTYKENIEWLNQLINWFINWKKCNDENLTVNKVYWSMRQVKNILENLHVFLIVTYLNLLRQSRLIEWDNIKINQLKITTKKMKDWTTFDESNFNFNVKLQPEVVREIYDFIYSNK